jgi:hypothetical protein
MTVPTPLQIALRQSRTRPTVVSGSIAGVGGGIDTKALGRLTAAVSGVNGTTMGSAGGNQAMQSHKPRRKRSDAHPRRQCRQYVRVNHMGRGQRADHISGGRCQHSPGSHGHQHPEYRRRCVAERAADHCFLPSADPRGVGVWPSMARKLQYELAYPPRAMKAERAAAYLDMSRSKFLELVEQGRLPKPKIIDGIRVWDRLAVDAAFNDFPDRSDGDSVGSRANTFDEVLRG